MDIAFLTSASLLTKKEATWLTLFLLAKEFSKKGHRVKILAKKHPSLPEKEIRGGIEIYRLYGKRDLFGACKALRLLLKENRFSPDIIHGFSASPFFALELFLAGKMLGKKVVHTLKSYPKERLAWLGVPALNLVNKVTFPTEVARREIERMGYFRNNAEKIFSPIDTKKFRPRAKKELLQKYGYDGRKLIFYYGALREEKGVDNLLKAAPRILEEHPDAYFLFAGRSREETAKEKYLQLAAKLGLNCDGAMRMVSFTFEDLPIEEYVAMAQVVVLAYPTLRGTEGNPSCLLESMASKTAIVTTSLPELLEIVVPEKEVLMAVPGEVASLAKQINRLLGDKTLQKKLTEEAYIKAEQFAAEKVADAFLKIYWQLL